MALLDAADLLARVKREADEPASSEEQGPTDADHTAFWYALLTEAQLHWTGIIAVTVPDEMYTQEKLTTADAGVSYSFSAEPMGSHYELRRSPTGALMVPGPEWDPSADFVIDGAKIRFPGQKAKTFTNGPWARYVPMPGVIDATHEPTLKPTYARILLVHRACIYWAERGGLRDPGPFRRLEDDAWFGDQDKGQFGLLPQLRQKAFLQGAAAQPGGGLTIFDLGIGT
jgi:hypothetical protein